MICNANTRSFRRGDWVEVRSFEEIAATLDDNGKLDGMPFMSEMTPYCGGRYRVYRRADKTCVEGVGLRRLQSAVFLEGLRCDGSAHDGCQRGCLFFWKEAWLRPSGPGEITRPSCKPAWERTDQTDRPSPPLFQIGGTSGTATACLTSALPTKRNDEFFCQSTELLAATSDFAGGTFKVLAADFAARESTASEVCRFLWRMVKTRIRNLMGRPQPGNPSGADPEERLDLQPGEWVEVKSAKEIVATLDANGKNRGMSFEEEMLEHCGRRYRVAGQVSKIILEEPGKKKTNQMVTLKHTVALEGVICLGLCGKNCPRANVFYWRESWLRRVK